ncbi:helix-turn-helix domain-containing protein [Asticcacaulis sp. 201]|uniref:AraC family transcriptional regulator n=1 Tax=Asticcacaulis sp. 201 TaxID=3028787 RepID=UPI002916EB4C|nr:helix-turn-helix domain-containing protein [Asticcacaulis sp. 201]MDV6329999.1 helix-turn-helix domain-containing protein [Asticcacaulis sp. 201]
MEYQQGLTIIGSVCVVLLVLLAIFFATVPSPLTRANRLFAAFLFLAAVDASGWTSWGDASESAIVSSLRLGLTFLQMPVLWLYVTAAAFSSFRLRPGYLWHAAPAVVVAGVLLLAGASAVPAVLVALHVQYYIYIAAAFLVLRRFNTIYRDNFSDASTRTSVWLAHLCWVSLIAHSFGLIKGVAGMMSVPFAPVMTVGVPLIALIVTIWIAAQALYQPDLFRRVDAKVETPRQVRAPSSEMSADIDRLLDHMRRTAPFTDPNLSLKKLARQMSMPARDLSVLINSGLGQSFFEFINAHRIDRAAELLSDPTRAGMSILDVLYDVGFNSKSSFNTAFRRRIGRTPSEYRRMQAK